MNFKIDENLPVELADDLRRFGHQARTVIDQGLAGAADELILQMVQLEGEVLLTLDKGIGDIRSYPPQEYHGIVLFRPPTTGRGATLSFLRRNLDNLFNLELTGRLVVVSDGAIRVR